MVPPSLVVPPSLRSHSLCSLESCLTYAGLSFSMWLSLIRNVSLNHWLNQWPYLLLGVLFPVPHGLVGRECPLRALPASCQLLFPST